MDRSYLVLAAKYIRRQAKQLAEQTDGIHGAADIEFVHHARVASRRLRAALRLFRPCFRRKVVARWEAAIRRVTKELGAARDKDVQISFVTTALARQSDPGVCRAVGRLLANCEAKRDRLQPRVVKAVKRLRGSGVLEEMQLATKRILRKVNADAVPVTSDYACRETARHIRKHLNELLSYQDSLAELDDSQRHHDMRIAAKRLRYTLEIANPVYAKQLGEAIEAVKQAQQLLGDVHDCDVWQEQLTAFADGERRRIAKKYGSERPFALIEPGLERLKEDRRTQRRELFSQLGDFWAELHAGRLWDRVAQLLECSEEHAGHNGSRGGDALDGWVHVPTLLQSPVATARPRTDVPDEPPRPHRAPAAPARERLSR